MNEVRSQEDIYRALHAATGGQLFTVTVIDRAAGLARRVYTSHPDTYPVSGTKPIQPNDWTRHVIDNAMVFVANTVEEFAIYFPDHALIQSLGCESAINIPVVDGDVVGTVNILDKALCFDEAMIRKCTSAVQAHSDQLLQAFASDGV
mgnify:CR=1 FL=1